MKIKYVKGDATNPILNPNASNYIIHCCNNKRAWGRGFVLALNKKSLLPRGAYYAMSEYKLGAVSYATIREKDKPDIIVANIIGQDGYGANGAKYVKYWALAEGFRKVSYNHIPGLSSIHIHAPRLGAGLAGGEWDEIEYLLNRAFCLKDIPVTIYDFP